MKRLSICAFSVALCLGAPSPVAALLDPLARVSRPSDEREAKPRVRRMSSDPEKRCPKFEERFRAHGLPVEVFSYIAWRESRCRIKAQNIVWDRKGNVVYALNRNGSFDTGLLQINSGWKTVTRNICGPDAVDSRMSGLLLLDCNLRVAKYLYENGGLAHWGMTG